MATQESLETVGVDAGAVATAALQTTGRLVFLAAAAIVTWRILRTQLARLDDTRLRDQLIYFVPRVMAIPLLFLALSAADIDVSAMAATMATVGLTGAVVFTPLGQNLVAGAMIRIDDVYRPGEIVTVDGLAGRVVYRSMLRTELALADGSTAYVPNSAFQESKVLNHSREFGWRMCVEVPLQRHADRERARSIMEAVVAAPHWAGGAHPPFVSFDHVGSEATFFNVYVWIDDRTAEPYYRGRLLDELVDALEAAEVIVGQTVNFRLEPSETGELPAATPGPFASATGGVSRG